MDRLGYAESKYLKKNKSATTRVLTELGFFLHGIRRFFDMSFKVSVTSTGKKKPCKKLKSEMYYAAKFGGGGGGIDDREFLPLF